jgi:RNA polymerase-binding transcription factor DksA
MSTRHASKRLERVALALEQRLADANRRLAALGQRPSPEEWDAGGDNTPFSESGDASRAVGERESDRLAASRLAEEVVNLQGALERIRVGAYGRCVECGRAVAPPRLEALPETSFCFSCETRHEAGPIDAARG